METLPPEQPNSEWEKPKSKQPSGHQRTNKVSFHILLGYFSIKYVPQIFWNSEAGQLFDGWKLRKQHWLPILQLQTGPIHGRIGQFKVRIWQRTLFKCIHHFVSICLWRYMQHKPFRRYSNGNGNGGRCIWNILNSKLKNNLLTNFNV